MLAAIDKEPIQIIYKHFVTYFPAQEIYQNHGGHLTGLANRLTRCGKSGRLKSNIERDMHRHVGLKVWYHDMID